MLLKKLDADLRGEVALRANNRVGKTVADLAATYSPISPKKSQGGGEEAAPGGLQNSIRHKATPAYVDIHVPINSQAGTYAVKMHDKKRKEWFRRGRGTVAKGPQADDKFIERAIGDSWKAGIIRNIWFGEIRKATRKFR